MAAQYSRPGELKLMRMDTLVDVAEMMDMRWTKGSGLRGWKDTVTMRMSPARGPRLVIPPQLVSQGETVVMEPLATWTRELLLPA